MSRTTYLHIGLHKTGTSAIQKTCAANSDFLAGLGLSYWSVARNHARPIGLLVGADAYEDGGLDTWTRPRFECKFGTQARLAAQFDAFLETAPGDVIISGETISLQRAETLERLKGLIEARGFDIRVIVYVREPVGWLNSLVQERVKWGETIAEAVASFTPIPYRRRLAPALQVFGAERVDYRLFHADAFPGRSLFRDFLSALGRPDVLPEGLREPRSNTSISDRAARVLDRVNAAARLSGFSGQHEEVLSHLMRFEGPPFVLDADLSVDVLRQSLEDIEWASDVLEVDLLPLSKVQTAPERRPLDPELITALAEVAQEGRRARARADYRQALLVEASAPDRAAALFADALARWPAGMEDARVGYERVRAILSREA